MTDFEINTNPRSSGRLHNEKGAVDVELCISTSNAPMLILKDYSDNHITLTGEHNLATLAAALTKFLEAANNR